MSDVTMQNAFTIHDVVMVFKPRIAVAIMLSAVGGMAVVEGASPGLLQLSLLAIAV